MKNEIVTLERSNQILTAGLKALADHLSQDLTTFQLVNAYEVVKDMGDVVSDLSSNARDRMLKRIEQEGVVVTEKGTMRLEVDGKFIEARPMKTGFDPKKIEGLLRAKGAEVTSAMDAKVTYVINERKLQQTVAGGLITPDELETCRFTPSYAVQRPKRMGEVSDE